MLQESQVTATTQTVFSYWFLLVRVFKLYMQQCMLKLYDYLEKLN